MVWHIAQDMMTLGFVDCRMYSTKGKLLEHNLDPEVRDALQSLKQQLRTGNNWILPGFDILLFINQAQISYFWG